MSYKLTVKPDDKVNVWLVFMDGRPITGFNKDHEVLLTLAAGEHRLTYEINGPGASIEVDIAEKPKIIVPINTTWPVTDKVPANETGTTNAIYFETV